MSKQPRYECPSEEVSSDESDDSRSDGALPTVHGIPITPTRDAQRDEPMPLRDTSPGHPFRRAPTANMTSTGTPATTPHRSSGEEGNRVSGAVSFDMQAFRELFNARLDARDLAAARNARGIAEVAQQIAFLTKELEIMKSRFTDPDNMHVDAMAFPTGQFGTMEARLTELEKHADSITSLTEEVKAMRSRLTELEKHADTITFFTEEAKAMEIRLTEVETKKEGPLSVPIVTQADNLKQQLAILQTRVGFLEQSPAQHPRFSAADHGTISQRLNVMAQKLWDLAAEADSGNGSISLRQGREDVHMAAEPKFATSLMEEGPKSVPSTGDKSPLFVPTEALTLTKDHSDLSPPCSPTSRSRHGEKLVSTVDTAETHAARREDSTIVEHRKVSKTDSKRTSDAAPVKTQRKRARSDADVGVIEEATKGGAAEKAIHKPSMSERMSMGSAGEPAKKRKVTTAEYDAAPARAGSGTSTNLGISMLAKRRDTLSAADNEAKPVPKASKTQQGPTRYYERKADHLAPLSRLYKDNPGLALPSHPRDDDPLDERASKRGSDSNAHARGRGV